MAIFETSYDSEQAPQEEATETSPLLGSKGFVPSPNALLPAPSFISASSTEYLTDISSSCSSTTASVASHDDEEALLQFPRFTDDGPEPLERSALIRIVLVLLIAVFIFNADHSLVLATHPTMGSEFNALDWSSWLFTSFGLAGAATQTMFGKLSDIYGRKPIILFSYIGFAIGCLIVALSRSMLAVILGRVLSGSVGAGMTVIVSILISDLVPIRESGTWRSYVNIAATTGRSLGGPLGGWLADAVGWRWSFGCQVPALAAAVVLCWRNLPDNLAGRSYIKRLDSEENAPGKFSRIDFLGSALLAAFILLLLLPLEMGGDMVPWSHPLIFGILAAAGTSLALFVLVEKHWAWEPILDLALFKQRDVVLCLVIIMFQSAAQLGMMFSVPLYFQVTNRASNTEAGARLFPSVAGNAIGGVFGGYFIKNTGKYKWLIYISMLSAALCYTLLLARWHGETNWLESFYIFPGGFGMGITHSVLFVATQASIDPELVSAAVSTLFLSGAIGVILGVACASAIMKEVLQRSLETRLRGLGLDAATRLDIISKAASSVEYLYNVTGDVRKAIVSSYIEGLSYAHGLSFLFVLVGFVLALLLRERKLHA